MRVYIEKKPNDPIAVRISAGGNWQDGAYIVYRGSLNEVRDILVEILAATVDFKERPVGVKTIVGRDKRTEKAGVCRQCGCTWTNPCYPACHWVDESQTLCSKCTS